MFRMKTAAALGLTAAALVLGVGAAAAATGDDEGQGTRVTSEQPEATKPPTLVAAPDGKDQ
ncbi:hypothetical protein SK803_07960 [Lentzea sp. BCCO 10_0856]|uniref:Uncharacterized protein n=1 Tax=Lentzea miocenica TaxID=3095431 RepID=A0ABU4SW68_9PSEU|nr:hypothetical protein [Lentzea sp. BCCO 10_0856]MDX8030141.1 hypothetical protein [Lentzea sp. BCCO 10_0856]